MRNMSFALTTEQIRNRTKTVTRRKGVWWAKVLKPGTLLCAVEKSQGIKKGGLVRLCVIRVVSVRTEPLNDISLRADYRRVETAREGFPDMSGVGFWTMFCRRMGGTSDQTVTRIEFEYTDEPVPGGAQ